jgi:uncharacterized protein (DUF1800 family)
MNGNCFRRLLLPLAALLLASAPFASAQEARLINLSTRAQTGAGANILTAGFVVGPGEPRQVLIRAVGPTLAGFGVTGTIANPVLTVFDADGKSVASNDDWGTPAAGQAALAATFAQVGAFPLAVGGRDSALVTTLRPGSYTAQVANATGATGETLVEVYQIGETGAKLVNLSTRLQVTATTSPIIGFVVAPGAGTRRLLVRNAGPALGAFGLTGTLPDPTLRLTDASGRVLASNDNWSVPANPQAADAGLLSAAFGVAGAFAFPSGSNDAAVMVDLGPGNYGIQVGGNAGSGLAIVEVYDLTPVDPPTITIAASRATADESGLRPGEFTFTRTGGNLSPLTIRYSVGGSAVNGTDYGRLAGTVSFPPGSATVTLPVTPNPDVQSEGTDSVVVTVAPGPNYLIGTNRSATVTIGDSPATLFIATVRPTTAATGGSTGYGTATILLSSSGTFAPVAPYSTADLQAALRNGQIAVRIDSAKYPGGELKGSFIAGAGSRAFVAPAAAPAAKLTALTGAEAARFLTQTTFGPTRAEIDALTGGSINTWLDAQMALPFSSHRTAIVDDRRTFGGSGSFTNWNAIHPPNRQSAWWKLVLTAPDQLRQRVAFALSQILVVSDVSLGDDSRAEPLAAYYDLLGQEAFGNFRTLLEKVTLNPMMAEYLSSLRNAKATFDASGAALTTPDENYAREVMQLFSIGLVRLQPDGTLQLGDDGLPIPTYSQTTITELAKVFTGWAYPSTNASAFRTAGANYFNPLQLFPAFHEDGPKNLAPVIATPIPASQGGAKDLQLALDALFQHPNTAPFISKLLIQRLVTSNPSPAYVYRVAQRFADDGAGVRGNLGAVVRAILTDHEARSNEVAATPSFGKLKEPVLRLTGILRGLKASSSSGRYVGFRVTVDGEPITSATPRPATAEQINRAPNAYSGTRLDAVQGNLAQAALRSPTVFNFYHSDYVLPGPLAAAGLFVPEFEITDDNFAISVPNFLRTFVSATLPTTNGVPTPAAPYALTLDLNHELTLVNDPAGLVGHFNLMFAAGSLTTDAQARIRSALTALPASTAALDRVRTALILTLTSPAAAIQK